jgi:glycosyltransferase involved in cell wall biosynthesis
VTRSAVVQDYFFAPGGAEEVAIALAELLPGSDVFTSFMEAEYRPRLTGHRVRTWPLQRLVGPTARYRSLLPLYPLWFERLDLTGYDLVISSSSAFAKAVRTRPGATHITYIHAPMRFAWDLEGYLAGASFRLPSRIAARTVRPWLRGWDRRTSQRPDVLVANSAAVAERIRQYWGREARVIHPPVPLDGIELSTRDDGYLLVAARLLAYRRLDVAIATANALGRELVIAGSGPEEARLRAMAGPSVRFTGRLDRPALREVMARCHAYLVPGEEDFGMAPVEAMAAGKPVVALRAGGALETVIDGVTGVHVETTDLAAFTEGIARLDALSLDPGTIRTHALRFAPPVFRAKMLALLAELGVPPSLHGGGQAAQVQGASAPIGMTATPSSRR